MKTTILADGTLYITPESTLDAYALGQWSKANLDVAWFAQPHLPKIIVDLSQYPGASQPVVLDTNGGAKQ
ncbi:hypothetical protein [Paraburkholderia terrae]|uniref:hypothetical protein n=1 Tax=Paraburkholderia terrae TaxID=311230 RepID=UPI001EE3174F|nr:hypothetical protein [Paraburkholderia terrae]GJH05019.1 hypothetical protein CBA19C8_30700 [Paraburkholderia terrae]